MNHIFSVEDYNSPLPDIIVMDTNFIYEMYSNDPENTLADECYNFTNRLVANKRIIVINPIITGELEHIVTKGIYRKHAKRLCSDKRWDQLLKETKVYMPEVHTEIDRVLGLLANNPSIVNLPVQMDGDFEARRRELERIAHLNSTDASIVVSALKEDINTFATIDIDYQSVPHINIYTPNPKLLGLNRSAKALIPFTTDLLLVNK